MRANVLAIVVALASCQPAPVNLSGTLSHRDDSSSDSSTDAGKSSKSGSDSSGGDDDDDDDTTPSNTPVLQNGVTADAGARFDGGTATCGSFKNVLAGFDGAGCTALFCHGTSFAPAITIDSSDAAGTYAQLTGFALAGKPYVKPGVKDPTASAIHCHLAGACGVPMPPGGTVPPAFVTTVDSWLRCGAPDK